MWIDIWVFCLVWLVLLSVLMPIPGCFQCWSSVVEFGIVMPFLIINLLCTIEFFYCSGLFWLSWVFCFSIWSWVPFFRSLWKILLGFWWALNWICRLLLVSYLPLSCAGTVVAHSFWEYPTKIGLNLRSTPWDGTLHWHDCSGQDPESRTGN